MENNYSQKRQSYPACNYNRDGQARLPAGWYGGALTKACIAGFGGLALIIASEFMDMPEKKKEVADLIGVTAIMGAGVGAGISTIKRAVRGQE